MSDRYFRNELPDFIDESEYTTAVGEFSGLTKLLYLPYQKVAEKLFNAGLLLKENVLNATWASHRNISKDWTLYTGALGTAFLLFKSYLATKDERDLTLCADIVSSCHTHSRSSSQVTFICGTSGVCALGAVAAKYRGDKNMLDFYLSSFQEIKLRHDIPNELLYGRAGYVWACSFLNKHLGEQTIPTASMKNIAKKIIKEGKHLSEMRKSSCPLMYEWHGKMYWGAAHGLAGIMHVLMDTDLEQEDQKLVKGTLDYMINNRFSSGNFPSSEGSESDRLVHWCHGAPGVALTLAKAAKVFNEEHYMRAAEDAARVVWNRGLLKRLGICHGISGNTYVFLSLYRLTGKPEYLYKAKAFASFLLEESNQLIATGKMHGGDRPHSLFEGRAGMAYLFLDMAQPSESKFPAYEL